MKAVILAGGKGTRLGKLSAEIPKPMIPILGKPLLEYQIELCVEHGITEVILLVNHLKEVIVNHFGDGERFGIPISYYVEERPLGTVGGIKAIEDQLKEDFLVLYGDVLVDMDLKRLFQFHREKESAATLVVHPNDHPYDSDLVELNTEDRVVAVHPKPHPKDFRYHNMVNAATYVFSPAVLQHLRADVASDFGKDVFPELHLKLPVFGYNTSEYLKDMGTPDRLEQVERDMASGKVKARNLKNPQSCIFLDRDGVINPDTDLIHRTEDFSLFPYTAEAIRKINSSEYLSIVTTNQSVIARGLTTVEGLGEIHKKMETELGNSGAKLDAIYFCPHHPDKGFEGERPEYKIDCHCRKPKAGMLTDAAARFNINLRESYMVGDSERDMQAGKAAGCTTVAVRSGHGVKNSRIRPDYFFENLAEAANYLIDQPDAAAVERIILEVENSAKAKTTIALSGKSRSGKSTLASTLARALRLKGYSVFRIHCDDWIVPSRDRKVEGVLENFQQEVLERDIAAILAGEVVYLNAYDAQSSAAKLEHSYAYAQESIVLLDGITTLATPSIRAMSDFKVYKDIEVDVQKSRFVKFYRWKGKSEGEIESLWKARQEEYRTTESWKIYADLVV